MMGWGKSKHYNALQKNWLRLFIQGAAMTLIGFVFAITSLMNPDINLMQAREFSLLPFSGIIIFLLGVQECLEAYFANELHEFYQNLQVGIMDVVVGLLIIFSVSEDPQQLAFMIAAFLIVRGAVRMVLVKSLNLPQKKATLTAGLISVLLGLAIVFNGFDQSMLLSFCINLEIGFRGWCMMVFAGWLRNRQIAK